MIKSDYKEKLDFEYFREWRILKRILVNESKDLEERIRCGEQLFAKDELFTKEIIEKEKARKAVLDSIIEYMNDAED